jgi:uncharacterized protein YuzE
MTITIGSSTFDNVFYDADVDVLYLHVGDPLSAVDFDESPEGHALRFDTDGQLVGVTIVGAKALIDREGEIKISRSPHHRLGYYVRLNPNDLREWLAQTRPEPGGGSWE